MKEIRGFTLIELVIVIVILGVLAAVALPRFVDLRADSKVAVLEGVAGAIKGGIELVRSKAIVNAQHQGDGEIEHNGVTISLYNGAPAINGRDSFNSLNAQLKAWLEIDSVSLTSIRRTPQSATFFIDKVSRRNQLYIFFSEDLADKGVNFFCYLIYQNQVGGEGPMITLQTRDC